MFYVLKPTFLLGSETVTTGEAGPQKVVMAKLGPRS